MKQPGIKDIARLSGSSIASVSRTLNKSGYVSAETRERIEKVVAELNYQPNAGARAMRSGRSHMIGVLLPSLEVEFFSRLAEALQLRLSRRGYQALLCSTGEDPEQETRFGRALLAKQVDGMIVASVEHVRSDIAALVDQRVPVVAIDRPSSDSHFPLVASDHAEGGRIAARHLLSLGHKKIAIFGAPSHSDPVQRRLSGAEEVLAEHGLAPHTVLLGTQHDVPACRALISDSLALPAGRRPTAILATSDLAAIGAVRAARAAGLSLPEDLSIIGFDDIPAARYIQPELTTIRQSHDELAENAIAALFSKMPGSRTLAVELVVRSSTAAPR